MAVHVRYKSLYISFPSSRKQQGEIAEFCGFFFVEHGRRLLMFVIFIWNFRRYIFGLSKF